jgi:hypothetical protein
MSEEPNESDESVDEETARRGDRTLLAVLALALVIIFGPVAFLFLNEDAVTRGSRAAILAHPVVIEKLGDVELDYDFLESKRMLGPAPRRSGSC